MSYIFEKAAPEEVGITSKSIEKFLEKLEGKKIPIHSFHMLRHGKLVAETYYAPYEGDMPHRMFSITKSFVSLAIGLLEEEGKLSLDDSIADYFKDKQPDDGVQPLLQRTTIRDMLKMQSPHGKTTFKQMNLDDWTKTFFQVRADHLPGTVFTYDTSASHTLAALVERLSGMELLEYLRVKFLDEIGFSKESYTLKDPSGVTQGGSGLVCTPMDILKVIKLVADGGVYNGKQLLPKAYLREAIKNQVGTFIKGATYEEMQGYGYQIWQVRDGGYCFYGMGGQYAVVLPKKDIIFVTTADTQRIKGGTQAIFDTFFDEIYDLACDEKLPGLSREDEEKHNNFMCERKLSAIPSFGVSKDIHIDVADNDIGLRLVLVKMNKERSGVLSLKYSNVTYDFSFELGENVLEKFPQYNMNTVVSAGWTDANTFVLNAQIIDECVGNVYVQIGILDDMATVMLSKMEETMFNEFNGYFYGKVS